MILMTEGGQQIRGDLIQRAVLRNSLVPVPVTLEAVIQTDESLSRELKQGSLLRVGGSGDAMRIIDVTTPRANTVQGIRQSAVVSLVAVLDAVHPMAFVRDRATMFEATTLATVYRAVGCKLKTVAGDVPAARFYVPAGQAATACVAKVLQEEGACVGWRNGLFFKPLRALLDAKPMLSLPPSATDFMQNGFLQRHEIPTFYSVAPDGNMIYGSRNKTRNMVFVPRKNAMQLANMSRCLVHRREQMMAYRQNVCAGDLVEYAGEKKPLVIVTVAHVKDGGSTYTQMWLASLEG